MITNKKGLSDIVTTALIILLVAVAVAAIWAFVAPALRGTGTQFTKTQVCVSNIIEPVTCKTTVDTGTSPSAAGVFPAKVQVRLTLSDGVAVPTEFETAVGTSPTFQKLITKDSGTKEWGTSGEPTTGEKIPRTQGTLILLNFDGQDGASGPVTVMGSSPQAQVTTTYKLPDNTIVKCPSLPISCNTA